MRGIRRTLGTAQRQAKALLRDDLFALLDRLGDRPKDLRDRALILDVIGAYHPEVGRRDADLWGVIYSARWATSATAPARPGTTR